MNLEHPIQLKKQFIDTLWIEKDAFVTDFEDNRFDSSLYYSNNANGQYLAVYFGDAPDTPFHPPGEHFRIRSFMGLPELPAYISATDLDMASLNINQAYTTPGANEVCIKEVLGPWREDSIMWSNQPAVANNTLLTYWQTASQ